MLNINLSNKIKNLLKKSNKIEMNDSSYEALDLLAEQMKINIEHLYIQLQIAIDKETSINAIAFSMYLGNLINLKNKLDYELKKYGSTSSENEMEVYKNLEGLIHDCRMLVTNNNFQFDKAQFDLLITTGESITTNELKRYVHNSLV
ncbi:TPA: hypothetical protein O1375_002470 [Staphylococcus aureus]|nr:hypothetical protein [Staphylococcus aureus]